MLESETCMCLMKFLSFFLYCWYNIVHGTYIDAMIIEKLYWLHEGFRNFDIRHIRLIWYSRPSSFEHIEGNGFFGERRRKHFNWKVLSKIKFPFVSLFSVVNSLWCRYQWIIQCIERLSSLGRPQSIRLPCQCCIETILHN